MFSSKTLATCAIIAAAAGGADAFSTGAGLPMGLKTRAAKCSVQMQGGESVADILARAAAMANGSVQPTHAGGNRDRSAGGAPARAASSVSSGAALCDNSVADILARANAMAHTTAVRTPAASAPASTATINRQSPQVVESVADILARAAAMASGSIAATHAGGNRHNQPQASAPSYSAPAPAAACSTESVADILARAAAMAGGAPAPAGSSPAAQQKHTAAVSESVADILARAAAMQANSPAPWAAAPSTPQATVPAARGSSGDSVAEILARAAAMANGSVQPTHAGGNRPRN
eukprot:CAMPEP_0206226514 /NCGR_PEP_ID=MMETSP0047_2-20121206/8139_1 /ASSEMBLY_ACC=CAM_ASM_000192 /TAXON_ID=195065 /ORGANISM="Chroomonas mesostigmatica_cf, Strain CCMP1168" /LENGTH=293 /DNA_ID=CAMNT_0053649621 /DNA_START=25 /DNA_END=906 /DNA_ORIENTATION=-